MSKRSQSTSLPQAALQLTGVSLLSQFLYFLYQAALSHIVGTEGLGLVHMVLPIYYTLLAFLTSGFALAISKLCSEYQSRTQSRGLTVIVSNTLFLFLVTLLLVALLFWLAYRTFANRWLAELPLGGYVLVLPLLLFFTGLEIFNKHYFYGINVVHIPAVIQITEQIVRITAVLALLLLIPQSSPSQSVTLILLGMLVSEVYSSLHLTYLRRNQPLTLPLCRSAQELPENMSRATIKIALPVSLTTLFCQSISSINSVLLPNLLMGCGMSQRQALQAYGVFFGMTLPLISVPMALLTGLSTVLLPYLTRCATLGQKKQAGRTLRNAFWVVLLVMAPTTAAIACFGPGLGKLFYGHPEAGRGLWPLAVGMTLSALEGILETALNAFDRQVGNAVITLVTSLMQLTCTVVYTNPLGLQAFVVGFLAATVFGCLLRGLLLMQGLAVSRGRATVLAGRTTPNTENERHTLDPHR